MLRKYKQLKIWIQLEYLESINNIQLPVWKRSVRQVPCLIKTLLLGMKYMFKHQDLQMFGLKINKYE